MREFSATSLRQGVSSKPYAIVYAIAPETADVAKAMTDQAIAGSSRLFAGNEGSPALLNICARCTCGRRSGFSSAAKSA